MFFIKYFSLISLLFLLSSCSGNKTWESVFAPNSALNEQPQNDQTINLNIVKLPDDFPQDIPIYPEAKLVQVEPKKVDFTSSDPVNLIVSFYEQQLTEKQWNILQKEDNLIIAQQPETENKLQFSFNTNGGKTDFFINYNNANLPENTVNSPNTQNPIQNNSNPNNINDLSTAPLEKLISLNIINETGQKIDPFQVVTRRQYARWLVTTNNLLFADINSKLIRLANPNSKEIFTDVSKNDPDFAVIQGLAEAGLIPSTLIQDTTAIAFRPDAPLTREDLIAWKVSLDFRQKLPPASLDTIKETWGFQDASKIKSSAWEELYVDWQNGENANIRKAFGYITLFQPQKSVTYEEVARVLSSFGYQGEMRTLNEIPENSETK